MASPFSCVGCCSAEFPLSVCVKLRQVARSQRSGFLCVYMCECVCVPARLQCVIMTGLGSDSGSEFVFWMNYRRMFIQSEKLQMMYSGRHGNSSVYHLASLRAGNVGRGGKTEITLSRPSADHTVTTIWEQVKIHTRWGHVIRPICHHWINRQAEVNYSTPFMMVTELLQPFHISSQWRMIPRVDWVCVCVRAERWRGLVCQRDFISLSFNLSLFSSFSPLCLSSRCQFN